MTSDKGIFYGYRIVAACSVVQAINLGGIFTFGVLFPELEREFGWSRATISGAISFAFLMVGGGAIFMGRAGDRFGPRAVLTVAGIVFGLGYALLFRMEAAWELYLYLGLLVGTGLAAHDVSTLSTIARWFVRRRGLMSGFVKAGGGVGQVVVPIAVAALIAGPGWRVACLLFGITSIVVIVSAAQVLRRNPASLGLKPDGEVPDASPNRAQQEGGSTFREAIRSRALWVLCIAKFCDLFCLFTVIVHIVPFAMDRGMEPTLAAGILSTIGGMSIIGRIVLGGAFDRIGARRSLLTCFAILTASLVLLQFVESAWSLFLFAMIYGPAHGGFFTITSPSVAEFFGTRAHGTIFGLVVTCGTLGATLGPIVAGSLFDMMGSYGGAFGLLLGFSLAGLVVASALPAVAGFQKKTE
ncbi:MAG: MFS transporter [Rhodospirillaceae bacterium]|nr:MFS transporter [Rhodospirillaceae bacterium]MBT4041884.1 MFS transporter [Rhodospirillaceae bacterium]MBT4688596.1 MFS transporter [Rhodospirillaceae bacterium]MBT5079091.1 MFS transporter [Rhodospirillaceae bacterium]MBT5526184.1 MFS transporter [Rhodospirillaceae bacterium]